MPAQKLEFIDALRGLAALYVLEFHLSRLTSPPAVPPRWLLGVVDGGGSGVYLFFMISAFTLSLSMESRGGKDAMPIVSFYIRRLFRIAPLFYAWMIVSYLRDFCYFGVAHSISYVAANALFLFDLFPGYQDGYVWASWTIGVEMLFYTIFPFIFFRNRNLSISLAFFAGAMVLRIPVHLLSLKMSDPAAGELFYEHNLVFNLSIFMAGLVVYHLFNQMNRVKAQQDSLGFLLITLFVSFEAYNHYDFSPDSPTLEIFFETVNFGILMVGLSISPLKILVNRITRFYGKISYSVYLSHTTIIYFMSPIFAHIYHFTRFRTIEFSLSSVVTLAVVTPISIATYRLIEQPGNGLGRCLIQRLNMDNKRETDNSMRNLPL